MKIIHISRIFPRLYLDKIPPKGGLTVECGKILANNGYKVRVFYTVNFGKSMHFNPFHYIHSEKDITINFKTRKHFKDKKSHYVPENEWTIFENTHEAIIDQDTWEFVQKIRSNVRRTRMAEVRLHRLQGCCSVPTAAGRCMFIAPTTENGSLNIPVRNIPRYLSERGARPSTASMKA